MSDRTFADVAQKMVRWLRLNPDAPVVLPAQDWVAKSQEQHTVERWSMVGVQRKMLRHVERYINGEIGQFQLQKELWYCLCDVESFGFRYGQNHAKGLPAPQPFDDEGRIDPEWARFNHNFWAGFDAGMDAARDGYTED